MLAGLPAEMVPTYLPLLYSTSITRYGRPKTVWNLREKLIFQEIVGRPLNCSNFFARTALFVEPFARLTAVTNASIAVAPVTKLPVAGRPCFALIWLNSFRTAGFGSSPKMDAKVTYQYFVTFGFFGYQFVPSPAHEFIRGVLMRRLRRPDTSAGQSPNVVDVTMTWPFLVPRIRLTRAGIWFCPWTKLSSRTTLPLSALKRFLKAAVTSRK